MGAVSSELNALQLEDIVGASLASVVKAQGLMATQLAEFIEKVGFELATGSAPLKARTFAFTFSRSELDKDTGAVTQRQVTAEVPLLSILALPSLAVDQATLQFDLTLVAHEAASGSSPSPSPTKGRLGQAELPRKLFAVPARKSTITQDDGSKTIDTTATLKVSVVARRFEPLGLQKIQALLDGAIVEKT